jgi:protein-tyrosine-phosphatase
MGSVKKYKSLEWYKNIKKVKKVLFVCSGNTCRSPSAVYYFKKFTSWLDGISAFSRGTRVEQILADLKARGINIEKLFAEDNIKKVIGDRKSNFLKKHTAEQIKLDDVVQVDLILTMERSLRDELKKEYSDFEFKIFTLKEFVNIGSGKRENLDIGNPFIPPPLAKRSGILKDVRGPPTPRYAKPYYEYIQNYMKILLDIEVYVRKLVEIIYLINEEKKK